MVAQPYPLSIRSYGMDSSAHAHDFSQLVLPLEGQLSVAIAGHEGLLDRSLAAFVEAGSAHEQESTVANQSLVLDIYPNELSARTAEALARRRFLALTPEANHLIDYMGLAAAQGRLPPNRLRLWAPLLLDVLMGDDPRPQSRLARLLALVEAHPSRDWSVERMAQKVGVSAGRLHAIFQEELGRTPRAWLSELRLERVRHGLAGTDLPIAELAFRFGYADQSALTRAMRKATGMTPAAFRRKARVQA